MSLPSRHGLEGATSVAQGECRTAQHEGTPMPPPVLLAVVEVPHDERVRCAAEGCGHSVYRRVHLVRADGTTKVYGSDCFARLFGSTPTGQSLPSYGSGAGRPLTPDERELLQQNTERLIEQFEQEHQAAIAEAERRRMLLAQRLTQHALPSIQRPVVQRRPEPRLPTPAESAEAEARARRFLAERFPGVDIDLPGFKGLLHLEVEKILRTNAA